MKPSHRLTTPVLLCATFLTLAPACGSVRTATGQSGIVPPPPPAPDMIVGGGGVLGTRGSRPESPVIWQRKVRVDTNTKDGVYEGLECTSQGDIIHPGVVSPFNYLIACPEGAACRTGASGGWVDVRWVHIDLDRGLLRLERPRRMSAHEMRLSWIRESRPILPNPTAEPLKVPAEACTSLGARGMTAMAEAGGRPFRVTMLGYGLK